MRARDLLAGSREEPNRKVSRLHVLVNKQNPIKVGSRRRWRALAMMRSGRWRFGSCTLLQIVIRFIGFAAGWINIIMLKIYSVTMNA